MLEYVDQTYAKQYLVYMKLTKFLSYVQSLD